METVDKNESLEERIKTFEREKNGLIGDLAKQREKNRTLEERLNVLETSLNEPEPLAPNAVEAEVEKFTKDPAAYIRSIAHPIIEERVKPLQSVLSMSQVERKLDRAMEDIADEEGITKKEAKKRYDEALSKVVSERGFSTLDPYDGTLAAYKIMKTETVEKEEKEEERDKRIKSEQSESSRASATTRPRQWSTSRVKEVIASGEYEKYRNEIIAAQNRGLITKD